MSPLTKSPHTTFVKFFRLLAPLLMILSLSLSALADGDIDRLAERLHNGTDFRVRVQAALELGKTKNNAARPHLEEALDDGNAAVRAAAAAALKVLGDSDAIPALTKHQKDKSAAVRSAIKAAIDALRDAKKARADKPRMMVSIGKMTNGSSVRSRSVMKQLDAASREKFGALPGVLLEEDGAKKSSKLPQVLVSGRLATMNKHNEGSQVVVSVKVEYIMHTMPGRSIRGKISGSATARVAASEVKGKRAMSKFRREVLMAAVESAMRRAPEALEAAAND
ncbi:MAG: HEAT repeat domain-containing protein [Polyangiaceae bacterium]